MNTFTRYIAAIGTVGALSACAASSGDWEASIADFAFNSNTQVAFAPSSTSEALPNTLFALSDGSERRVSDAVVRGEFLSSEPARAMDWDSGEEVDWDDDAAQTRTIKAAFAVSEVVAAAEGVEVPHEVDVFVTLNGDADAEAVSDGLVGAGESVLFLRQHWDRDFTGGWAIAQSGSLLMTVADSGELVLPIHASAERRRTSSESAQGDGHDEMVEQDLTTLAALRSAAGEPDTVIDAE